MTMAHTPIIANMCDGCTHITKFMGCEICKLHKQTLKLPCVKNNEPCPDYHKKSVSEPSTDSSFNMREVFWEESRNKAKTNQKTSKEKLL